jgi:hypothetical protein
MNSVMKHRVIRLGSMSAAVLATATLLLARPSSEPRRHGTDILHFFARTTMVDSGSETNAIGRVEAGQNQQGAADIQRLEIFVSGLETNTSYALAALSGADTNFTSVARFDTDARGHAVLRYRRQDTGPRGNPAGHHGLGHGRSLLPDVLNPVSHIRELAIVDRSTQAVLTADLTLPDRFQYLIKRDLSTNGVTAFLRIKAGAKRAQFHLRAGGLTPTADYWLVVNGGTVQTNTSDARGRMEISSLMQPPTDILMVRSLALWDTSTNIVFSTELP